MSNRKIHWAAVPGVVLAAAALWVWISLPPVTPPVGQGAQALNTQSPGSPQPAPVSDVATSKKAAPAPIASPSGETSTAARDDSTYLRMISLAGARPDGPEVTRRITERHEAFVLTPDDPGWGRRTEQDLRDFFRSRAANKSTGIEITSIACRSAGCEVQAQVQMGLSRNTAESDSDSPASGDKDPREALREISPLGSSLKQDDYIGSDLFDNDGTAESVGFMVWYSRAGN